MSRFGCYGFIDRNAPEAAGVCDRGGEVRKLRDLHPEMEWRGGRLQPNGFMVCHHHMDRPNPQVGGPTRLRPDPVPVRNPRPDPDLAVVLPPVPVVPVIPPTLVLADPPNPGASDGWDAGGWDQATWA